MIDGRNATEKNQIHWLFKLTPYIMRIGDLTFVESRQAFSVPEIDLLKKTMT